MALYFKLEEFTYSDTAKALGIDNTPPKDVRFNIAQLINFLDDLRSEWAIKLMTDEVISDFNKGGLVIKSGYRCPKLNKAVGGARTSQHTLGQAADIHTKSNSKESNKQLFELIKQLKLPFDQLINEYNYSWIHVSYSNRNRRQILNIK